MKKRLFGDRFYRFLLRLFPFDFRREFGADMEGVFSQERRHAAKAGIAGSARLWWMTVLGFLKSAPVEHIDVLQRDLRYGLRSLRKSPAFVLVAITALGIGIGANLTIFGFANALLLRPLKVPQASEVIQVFQDRWSNIGYEEYIQYRDRNRTISKLAISSTTTASIQSGGAPEAVTAMAVSGNYFESLRISAVVGRLINEADDKRGAPGAVVLGFAYWRHRFGSDSSIIGKTISVDGSPFTIVGVIPSSFNG